MKKRPALGAFVLCTSALLGIAGSLSVGCKAASCEAVCEQRNTCEGQQPVTDCAAACDAEQSLAEAAGCAEEYDAKLSCQGTLDSCTSSTFCAGQDAAYFACLNEACSKDPQKCAEN